MLLPIHNMLVHICNQINNNNLHQLLYFPYKSQVWINIGTYCTFTSITSQIVTLINPPHSHIKVFAHYSDLIWTSQW
jgi:hypothetical protein